MIYYFPFNLRTFLFKTHLYPHKRITAIHEAAVESVERVWFLDFYHNCFNMISSKERMAVKVPNNDCTRFL